MVYHKDLSTNSPGEPIRVGWLDRCQTFTQGPTDGTFLGKLKALYNFRVRQTRGFHVCPFCEERRFGLPVEMNGKMLMLGSAEIEVADESGSIYAAPDLIYHYIVDHGYLPPPEFIRAVCQQR